MVSGGGPFAWALTEVVKYDRERQNNQFFEIEQVQASVA
jgi:hypothetical protein